jgi:Right handed beta helix region
MRLPRFLINGAPLAAACVLLAMLPGAAATAESRTVTVGPAPADIIGTDNAAIQKAIDRVAQAGGGTVLLKAGTYELNNSVRLTSHLTLRGEGAGKTVLKRAAGIVSKMALDADYGEMKATVEDASKFRPGMGITVVDKVNRSGWVPSVRTITRIEGNTLYFDRFLQMDYSVENGGMAFNTFPMLAGYDVQDVTVEDLEVDGNKANSETLDGCQSGAIYFFHSQKMTIRNCVAHDYPGDGISTQFVEDPVVEHCDSYANSMLGIHLGTGAARGIVRFNKAHDNGEDGLYLCWRVQHALYEGNESWGNGQDGISIGHRDTDNLFVKNNVHDNGRYGIFFRDENASNAGSRNTLKENIVANNGKPGESGSQIHIEGATRDLTFIANTIRDTRVGPGAQLAAIYIGPNADYIVAEQNVFDGSFKPLVADESKGGHNRLQTASGM